MGDLFLGLDLSTQSLKCVIIDQSMAIVHSDTVLLDDMGFNTTDGFIDDGKTVTAPTLMFVSAMDTLFSKLSSSLLSRVKSISASGQQHGTVYWAKGASNTISQLDPNKTLVDQLANCFSKENSPIWMDSSTKKFCSELTEAVGGPGNLTKTTGSAAFERFSINQIFKFASENEAQFQSTERIELISSFVMSLLLGRPAPIDFADGSGMNVLDITTKSWCDKVLKFGAKTYKAENMERLLGEPVATDTIIGTVASYWTKRYEIPADCKLIAATGDNPSSFAGLNIGPGSICLSLGTSDTVFMDMKRPQPQLEGHVFVNPIRPESYMGMLCYKNGSLIRQSLRDELNLNWEEFGQAISESSPSDHLYIRYDYEEITPVLKGVWTYKVSDDGSVSEFPVDQKDKIRALIDTQIVAKRAHALRFGFDQGEKVIVTGGASSNKPILQVVADVFQLPVHVNTKTQNSAAMGAAYRALYCAGDRSKSYNDTVDEAVKLDLAAAPNANVKAHYDKLVRVYSDIEDELKS